jgi:putative membrane protein
MIAQLAAIIDDNNLGEKEVMLNFLLTWVVSAVSILVTAKFVPGIHVDTFQAALLAAGIIGFINAIVRPIITLFTLPLTILSLGLFLFVVNAISLSLAGWLSSVFKIGFSVDGFWPAFFGAIVLSLVSGLLSKFVNLDENTEG